MQNTSHKLSLTIKSQKTATEGKNFDFTFKVKNIGDRPFLGGTITIQLSWKDLPEEVYKVINIANTLEPNEESSKIKYSQEPLSTGFTWFYVVGAVSSDGNPVQVFKDNADLMFPHPMEHGIVLHPVLHAIRTRTIDQIHQLYALIATAVSLSSVVALQIIDWILRYYFSMP